MQVFDRGIKISLGYDFTLCFPHDAMYGNTLFRLLVKRKSLATLFFHEIVIHATLSTVLLPFIGI